MGCYKNYFPESASMQYLFAPDKYREFVNLQAPYQRVNCYFWSHVKANWLLQKKILGQ